MNECYSPLWQERVRSPGTVFTLWSPVLAKRRQISAGSSLRAKSPDPTQLVIAEGARCPGPNLPLGSSGHPEARGQVPQTASYADCRCNKVAEAVMGEFITTSKSEPRLGQGSGPWQDTAPNLFPGFSQPPHLTQAWWAKGSLGEGEGTPLTSLSTIGSLRGPPFPWPLTEQGH